MADNWSMRKLAVALLFLGFVTDNALARDTHVRGYTRSDGTYVAPHHRTTPDNTVNNNYGTQGNRNPYTNEDGDRPRNTRQSNGSYNNGNGAGSYSNSYDRNYE